MLKHHAACLGSSGSGKTTLALNIIEQLLLRGVPAILVDRKGDLVTYADPTFWAEPSRDPVAEARRHQLAEHLDVRIYTPGDARGRPLWLPVVPRGLDGLTPQERALHLRFAASALGAMLGYKDNQADRTRLAILTKALEVLASVFPADEVTLNHLIEILANRDPALVDAVGRLDTAQFDRLVEHLETLRIHRGELLGREGDPLDVGELFGLGAPGGRTRLSVISTKFLGDNAAIEFWVARLLTELGRWSSKHPSDRLQAVLFLDEADLYLPANKKPATKEPMQDLLRRARSAGVGVLIATQSPGDLDYKCRDNIHTWLVGKVAERTAVDKMRPLLAEYPVNVAPKLATAGTGEFFLLGGGKVVEMKAERSVMTTRQLPEEEILTLAQRP